MSKDKAKPAQKHDTRLIAFYLPQYHPIPENDKWWGKGFTEWTNVSKAKPNFEGHYQPHLPGELGFYDLRVDEVREEQARLASEYGIHGFCYYYYWFNGRRVLEKPLEAVLKSGKPDFPFCICWANETWSRRWDGSENEVLLKQEHTPESDEKFILDVIPILKDPRYIRVDGAPLLMVYRLGIMPDPSGTAKIWRKICEEHGIKRIHLCAVQSFGFKDPVRYGFDSACQFPPHDVSGGTLNHEIKNYHGEYTGFIYDYKEIVRNELQRTPPDYKYFRGVMPSWDNTARRGSAGNIFYKSSPKEYELWLRGIIEYTRKHFKGDEKIVFINAWNEWAEGAHLEPDREYGREYLEATLRAITGNSDWRMLLKLLRKYKEIPEALLNDVEASLEAQARSVEYFDTLNKMGETLLSHRDRVKFTDLMPFSLQAKPLVEEGKMHVDNINATQHITEAVVEREYAAYVSGWAIIEGAEVNENSAYVMLLRSVNDPDKKYYGVCRKRMWRKDVAEAHPQIEERFSLYSGFSLKADFSGVEPGRYSIGVMNLSGDVVKYCSNPQSFSII